jgi:hypothetical protein
MVGDGQDRGLTELAEDLEREGVPEEGVVPDGPEHTIASLTYGPDVARPRKAAPNRND